ncbi:MAG: ABC transporter ATP-binding protein [Bacillota bacterium]
MITAKNLTKRFDDITALDDVTLTIKDQNVFGLIGTNGAGKSTFLKLCAGIMQPDSGSIQIDNTDIYENLAVKEKFFYISDEQYFLSNTTPEEMKNFYKTIYKHFDETRFYHLMNAFDLNPNRKIKTFSKGMKKQVSVICGVCTRTQYLFCDETFDGLDPVIRQVIKSLFAQDIEERGLTPIIASHNLREIEDICDNVGILHKGGMLLSKDLEHLRGDIHKVQIVFKSESDLATIKQQLDIVKEESRGTLFVLTIRGDSESIHQKLQGVQPTFFEMLPLTLEEVFIVETEVKGYDIKSLIL